MGIATFPPASSASGFSRSALITSSGTWTHPDGASGSSPKPIMIQMTGGGGGGSSGVATANISTGAYGIAGGGGGSSGLVVETYAVCTGTLTLTVGAGGNGGSARTTTTTTGNSNAGNDGGITQITFPLPFRTLIASGGKGHEGNYAQGSGNIITTGMSGGTASPSTLSFAANTGSGVVGLNGLSAGASDGAQNASNSQSGNTNFFGQGNLGEQSVSVANATTAISLAISGLNYVKQSSLPAGSGAEGGHNQNSASNYTRAGGTGGFGVFGPGGNGGTSSHVTSGTTAAATAGSTPTGYGGGGGGGGAASNRSAGTTVSGAGGAGAPGAIIIYY
jgi:hypothetical protein